MSKENVEIDTFLTQYPLGYPKTAPILRNWKRTAIFVEFHKSKKYDLLVSTGKLD